MVELYWIDCWFLSFFHHWIISHMFKEIKDVNVCKIFLFFLCILFFRSHSCHSRGEKRRWHIATTQRSARYTKDIKGGWTKSFFCCCVFLDVFCELICSINLRKSHIGEVKTVTNQLKLSPTLSYLLFDLLVCLHCLV